VTTASPLAIRYIIDKDVLYNKRARTIKGNRKKET
jgi:hypothetical protein